MPRRRRHIAGDTTQGGGAKPPPARAGSWKDDQGHRGTGAGSASRHGGGLGRVHPHDRVPGIPLSYRTGCTRRHGGRRGPPTGCALLVLLLLTRDSDRLAARWTPYSTGDLSRLATFLRLLTKIQRKKERKRTTQGRDGRTARRHHTGILRRGV